MAHLAIRAFYPSKPPFPLLHVDSPGSSNRSLLFETTSLVNMASNSSPAPMKRGGRPASRAGARGQAVDSLPAPAGANVTGLGRGGLHSGMDGASIGAPGVLSQPIIGRTDELRRLRFAIADRDCMLVVLRGPAGGGKTALAQAALEHARREGSLTGSGKYAEGDAQSPFEPILQALSEAVGQGLDQLYEPGPVMAGLMETLGPSAEVLRRAGFRGLVGGPSLAIGAAGRRETAALLTEAILQLVGWLEGFNLPVVLLIDDWRRNAAESREVLTSLAEEYAGHRLTLLLTERDDQPSHELSQAPGALTLDVGGLRPEDRRALFVDLLGEAGVAAFDGLGEDGLALPFDIVAAAQALSVSGALVRDGGGWRIDQDLAEGLMAPSRRRELSPAARRLAVAVAVWGDAAPSPWLRFGLQIGEDHFDAQAKELEVQGLARRRGESIQFVHDRLREQVLAEAGDAGPRLAGELADRLAAGAPEEWPAVSYAALHLRRIGGLEDADPEIWRDRFAAGAHAARGRLDSVAASGFAESAWALRSRAPATDPAADRAILREALMAAADRKDAALALSLGEDLIARARSERELGEDQELAIDAVRACGDPELAWAVTVKALARFGVKPPRRINPVHLLRAAQVWRRARRNPSEVVGGEAVNGLTRTAHAAASLAFERSPAMAFYIACQGFARAPWDLRALSFWKAVDTYLSSVLGDFAEAARLGQQAIDSMSVDAVYRASALYRAYYFGVIWVRPMASIRRHNAEIHDLALIEGDLATAMVAARNDALQGWRTHASLPELKRELEESLRKARRLGDASVIAGVLAFIQAADIVTRPPGSASVVRHGQTSTSESQALRAQPVVRLELASFAGDWAAAVALTRELEPLKRGADSHPGGAVWRFHEGLTRLKTGRRVRPVDLAYLAKVAALNPADHRHKLLVLEAEALHRRGRLAASLDAYAEAVPAALSSACRLEAGLACECAAEAARAAGRANLALDYEAKAQAVWVAWGAAGRLAAPLQERMETRLVEALDQALTAEREGRAKSRFLADVAHELRTPLQGMQGLLDLAAETLSAVELAAFREVFASLKTVVDDLTDFGALASGESRLNLGPVALVDLVRSEATVMASVGDGAEISLFGAVDLPPLVETDGARVRQVVRNLLSNAVKYGRGGPIAVTLEILPSGGEAPYGIVIVIVVEDRGPGLSEVELRRIFEPFERGPHAGDGRGLGLGLALSRRLAEQLGGSLRAGNRNDGGAHFTFRLPATPVRDVPGEPQPPLRPLNILLAEDVALVRHALAANLRRDGHGVSEAADGLEAWRLCRGHRFDLVILDWSMPGLGGEALLDRLGGAAVRPRPPAIVLTASSDPEIIVRARAAGAALVLRKPVTAQELVRAITNLMGQATETPSAAAFDLGMAELRSAARDQLDIRVDALTQSLRTGATLSAADVHKLAGLAAQFGWSGLADAAAAAAADALERNLLGDKDHVEGGVQALRAAHAALPPA
jgi:signal transduction histidine kinase/DNA-binding response OmpR family regulator